MALRLGSVGTCNVSVSREWDGHGRSVGRSVDARGPVDHDSVGLAQARPNVSRCNSLRKRTSTYLRSSSIRYYKGRKKSVLSQKHEH